MEFENLENRLQCSTTTLPVVQVCCQELQLQIENPREPERTPENTEVITTVIPHLLQPVLAVV